MRDVNRDLRVAVFGLAAGLAYIPSRSFVSLSRCTHMASDSQLVLHFYGEGERRDAANDEPIFPEASCCLSASLIQTPRTE